MEQTAPKRRVVITGYGTINPLGENAGDTFERASRGESGIDEIRAFDTTNLPCRVGGEIDEAWLEPLQQFDRYNNSRLDKFASRAVRLMVMATREATEMARLDEIADRHRVGFSLGSHGENPPIPEMKFLHRFYREGEGWDIKSLSPRAVIPLWGFCVANPMWHRRCWHGCSDARVGPIPSCPPAPPGPRPSARPTS